MSQSRCACRRAAVRVVGDARAMALRLPALRCRLRVRLVHLPDIGRRRRPAVGSVHAPHPRQRHLDARRHQSGRHRLLREEGSAERRGRDIAGWRSPSRHTPSHALRQPRERSHVRSRRSRVVRTRMRRRSRTRSSALPADVRATALDLPRYALRSGRPAASCSRLYIIESNKNVCTNDSLRR